MNKLFFLIAILYTSSIFSQTAVIGEQSPDITIDKWINPAIDYLNEELFINGNNKITIIDFWFTKCAPCVASIPKLNHLSVHYPEILFLSITFEEEKIVWEFLEKMTVLYPIGSDTALETIKAFGVKSYPETFIIDKQGIILWRGSPFDLNEELLNEMIGRPVTNQKFIGNNSELPNDDHAYFFTIKKHDLEMGESSYYHYNPFDIKVFNNNLKNILKVFYGVNEPRLLNKDSTFLHTAYDLTLKVNKEITTEANCIEMLKYLLPKELNLELHEIIKDTLVGNIQIENDSILNESKSNVSFFGTTTTDDNIELKGASLSKLRDFMENKYSILLEIDHSDGRVFDFVLPVNDIENVKEILKRCYGLRIKMKNQLTNFWLVEKGK